MLVSQTDPVGVELFSYANAFFCSNKWPREWKNSIHNATFSSPELLDFISSKRNEGLSKRE